MENQVAQAVAAKERKKRSLSDKSRKVLSILGVVIFILFSVLVFVFIGKPMLEFVSEPELFREWVNAHGFFGRLAFIGMMVLQIVIALIPGEILEIGAGYAFGMLEGTLLCMVASVIGSCIVFLFVRTFGIKAVEVFFPIEKIRSLKFLQDNKKTTLLVFILTLIPGTPKDLIGYFVALTTMKLSTWLIITATARIPSIITSTIGGDALGLQNYSFAIIVFAITIVISIIGLVVFHRMGKHKKAAEKTDSKQA